VGKTEGTSPINCNKESTEIDSILSSKKKKKNFMKKIQEILVIYLSLSKMELTQDSSELKLWMISWAGENSNNSNLNLKNKKQLQEVAF